MADRPLTLAEAFKRHIAEELSNVWPLLPPANKDMYSKAWRRGYARGRQDAIADNMVRPNAHGASRSNGKE